MKVVEPSDGGGATPTPTAAPTTAPTAAPTATPTGTPTTAPTSAPTATPTGGSGDGGDGQCADVQDVLLPILQHLNAAHLERSPGQQVQDALALDSCIKTHTVWIESILTPLTSGGGAVADDTLGVLLDHINKAHLEESLGQQVTDLLNPDSYVKMHTVWAEHLLAPTESFVTGSC
ncbi:hypothetical protein ABZ835_18060 [Streptomyces sp. NPDC047461]|uniref:hypothetical protein n=1 Tax=Streptomyces sp. NPDC047461 TaxID=3155619 RepID=UPI0033E3741B